MSTQGRLAAAAWISLAGVVYLTLLPFDFRFSALSFGEAVDAYRALRFGVMYPGARQQWIANAIMFFPLGFFWAAWLTRGATQAGPRLLGAVAAGVLALFVTATVEFLQSWIPGRAPSLLDMSGNFAGGAAGAAVWLLLGDALRSKWSAIRAGGVGAVRAVLGLYVLIYAAATLLPFDLLLSVEEIRTKLASGHWGVVTAPAGCDGGLRCLALRLLDAAVCIPVGFWLALRLAGRTAPVSGTFWPAMALAVLFGFGLEIAQFFTVSGIAEGSAALTRTLGVVAGSWVGQRWLIDGARTFAIPPWIRTALLVAFVPYLFVLIVLNLGGAGFRLVPEEAGAKLAALNPLPFYYHYYVAEATALFSVMAHFWMYAPMGVFAFLWWHGGWPRGRPAGMGAVVLAAVSLALLLEGGKLFMAGLRPDPTTPWIAGVAAWLGWTLSGWLWLCFREVGSAASAREAGPTDVLVPRKPVAESVSSGAGGQRREGQVSLPVREHPEGAWMPGRPIMGGALLASALVATASWPAGALWLTVAMLAYVAWLWRRPAAWLLVVPVLVPVLNLSLYSGRFLVDEFDLFLLATAGVLMARARRAGPVVALPWGMSLAWWLFLFSLLFGAGVLLASAPLPGANDWAHYASPYNALRAAKGALWAAVLLVLLPRCGEDPARLLERWFVPGMALGLAAGVAVVMWERMTFPGLFNLESRYRITGLFTDMHVGGPSIETWLVLAVPFALSWCLVRPSWRRLLAVLPLLGGAFYGLMVTYSRGGYLGMGVSVLVMIVGVAFAALAVRGTARRRLALVVVIPVGLCALALPQVTGVHFEQRMSRISDDFQLRIEHWRLARALHPPGVRAALLGDGPGAFPRRYAQARPDGITPANFGFSGTADDAVLRIGTGDSLFLNQRIALIRGETYVVEVDGRADRPARLRVYVCEKFVRHSYECRSTLMDIPENPDGTVRWRFDAEGLGSGPWFARRILTFSIANVTADSVIELARVSLRGPDGTERLRNGDFSQGAAHWYFTTDHLWPWRIENQWFEILFDQGWVGLCAFVALVLIACARLTKGLVAGRPGDAMILASLLGVLAVGVFSTVFWSPRLMFLFFWILLLGAAASASAQPRSPGRGDVHRP